MRFIVKFDGKGCLLKVTKIVTFINEIK